MTALGVNPYEPGAFPLAPRVAIGTGSRMTDPYDRIRQHLGTAFQHLAVRQARAANPGVNARDVARSLTDLQQVADELDHAYQALKTERLRLKVIAEDAEATLRRARRLFVESPSPCLVVLRDGASIAEANTAASLLLNVSVRHLVGKPFTNFLQHDRDAFLRQLQQRTGSDPDRSHVTLRPRERAVVHVLMTTIPDGSDTAAILLSPEDAPLADAAATA